MRRLLLVVIALHKRRDDFTKKRYQQYVDLLEAEMTDLLTPEYQHPAEEYLANRLRRQREHLLTCLKMPGVDPTNNLAERQLRPAVIARKLSAGNKTDSGARTFAVLASLAETCHQQGRSFAELVASAMILTQRPPPTLFPEPAADPS